MTANQTARALRIEFRRDSISAGYFVCVGSGLTFRAFGMSVTEKAAKAHRAAIRKNPAAYGIV